MKIILTGSLGHIGLPLTNTLVQKGHAVTVITTKPDKQSAIEALGANAAIGDINNADFLTRTFTGADAVYCMIPLNFKEEDQAGYYNRIGNNYIQAIKATGVKRIVNLSGWAAHVVSTGNAENIFNNALPNVTHIRPGYFYTNFFGLKDMIKGKGMIGWLMALRFYGLTALLTGKRGLIAANFGGDDKILFVAPADIADAVAEELVTTGRKIRYAGSEELTCNEAARLLGTAIGKPYLKWATLTDKQMLSGLKSFGMPAQLATTMVEMQAGMHNGVVVAEYYKNRPPAMGKVKMADFVKEFAAFYQG
jgi:NAD(P)H dehydrogenase (quinone)